MGTLRQLVSNVRMSFKLTSSDNIATDRFIASEIIKTNVELCTQQLQKRVGYSSPSLFTTLDCIELVTVPLAECCDFKTECNISRSKDKLPQIVDTYYSLAIQGVFSIDKRVRFKELTNPQRYSDYLHLKKKKEGEKFFWVKDNYLYVTDDSLEKVSISAFFAQPIDAILYSCSKPSGYCASNPLDLEFKTLPKLEDAICRTVAQKLLNTYKRSIPDGSEDDLDTSK